MREEDLPEGSPYEAGISPPVQVDLPLDAEAFYLVHQGMYHAYAEAHLGNRRAAEEAAHLVFAELLAGWAELLTEGNLEQSAWRVLRRVVREQLEVEGRLPAYIVNGPVAQMLRAAQGRLAKMESSRGVYTAIAELPPRQCDVIVLRHILGHPTRTVASFMGLDDRTVDYHHRRAKERLRVLLGLPADPAPENHEKEEGLR
ncbi:RNA polymerase sigma factor [Streptomyces sp. SBT349]|uniref:RNA polymerase sigma factor n=1 Tax=Streptomyces sp. SBT349 TaxID=1580539 RepID=UPI00066CD972|nr:sigma-70 family RNA polymerase sigma factor [Streptomyces sp. SBT349]